MASTSNFKPPEKKTATIDHNKASSSSSSESSPHDKKQEKSWNDMSHLSIKRFHDDDPLLTQGARRNRAKQPFVACAQMDPSGRSKCKLCGDLIPKGTLRLCLMMECHKGYRNLCTLHPACFWQHPETKKLDSIEEIAILDGVSEQDLVAIRADFESYHIKSTDGKEREN